MTPTVAMKLSLLAWARTRIMAIDDRAGRNGNPLAEGRIDAFQEMIDLLNHLVEPSEDPLFGAKSFRDLAGDDPSPRVEPVPENVVIAEKLMSDLSGGVYPTEKPDLPECPF